MIFLTIFIIPFIIVSVSYLITDNTNYHKITLKEFFVLIGISLVISILSVIIVYNQNIQHTEIINGIVTKKERVKVSCKHSYECYCYTICDSKGNCSRYCQTCYEHPHDFEYRVYDNTGKIFYINTIDRQGVNTPERFNKVIIGEPTSWKTTYKNYIKASKGNLFKKQGIDTTKYQIPKYPQNIYDYYKYNRVISQNINIKDISQYQEKLSKINGKLGPIKECNIIVVLIKNQPFDYFNSLEQSWIGGHKNDIIVVINVDNDNKINWTNILCLSDDNIFEVKLRDEILSIQDLDLDKIFEKIEVTTTKYYKRKSMKNFEYLKSSITPTGTQLLISIIINSILCLILTIFFYKEDIL